MTATIEWSVDIENSGKKIRVECFGEFITKDKFKINKELFEKMCKDGCSTYGKHYGCPPNAPSFDEYTKGSNYFLVLMFCAQPIGKSSANFEEIENLVYPKIDKILRRLEKAAGTKHIAARSCRLCEPCLREKNLPCRHPEERRNCTVSLGIDCRAIAENIFHKSLVWQKGENLKGYTSFICLVPLKRLADKSKLLIALTEKQLIWLASQ